MGQKKHKPEEIVARLRQVDVLLSQGCPAPSLHRPHRSEVRSVGATGLPSPGAAWIDAALTADVIELATQYGRYGYRRITALLRDAGWVVNVKHVERIRRQEGLRGHFGINAERVERGVGCPCRM